MDIKRHLILVGLLFFITALSRVACSEEVSGYVIKIQQTTSLEFTLHHNSGFYIEFVHDGAIKSGSKAEYFRTLDGILFTDKDCRIGHAVQIRYGNNKKQYRYIYFKNEVAWGQPVRLTLSLDQNSNTVRLQVNDEEVTFEPKIMPKYFYVPGANGNINLEADSSKVYVED